MSDNFVLSLIILSVATWRISRLLVYENGPFRIFDRLRIKATRKAGTLLEVFTCIYCMSIWVGFLLTGLFYGFTQGLYVLFPFVFSAGAIIIEEIIDGLRK